MRKLINKIKIICYSFYNQSIYNPILEDLESESPDSPNKKTLEEMSFVNKLFYRFNMIVKRIIMQGVSKKNDFAETPVQGKKIYNSLTLFKKSQAFFRGLAVILIDNPILEALKSENSDSPNKKTLEEMSFVEKLFYRFNMIKGNITKSDEQIGLADDVDKELPSVILGDNHEKGNITKSDEQIGLADDVDKELPSVILGDNHEKGQKYLKLLNINKYLESNWNKKDTKKFDKIVTCICEFLEDKEYSFEINPPPHKVMDCIKFAELICKSSVSDKINKLRLSHNALRNTHHMHYMNELLSYKQGKEYSLSEDDLNFIRQKLTQDNKEVYTFEQNSKECSFIPLTFEDSMNYSFNKKAGW